MAEIKMFPGVDRSRIEKRKEPPPLIEPAVAPEFFVGELSRVDMFGSFARLTFSTPSKQIELVEEDDVRVVTVKLVVPAETLSAMHTAIGARLPATEPNANADQSTKDNLS